MLRSFYRQVGCRSGYLWGYFPRYFSYRCAWDQRRFHVGLLLESSTLNILFLDMFPRVQMHKDGSLSFITPIGFLYFSSQSSSSRNSILVHKHFQLSYLDSFLEQSKWMVHERVKQSMIFKPGSLNWKRIESLHLKLGKSVSPVLLPLRSPSSYLFTIPWIHTLHVMKAYWRRRQHEINLCAFYEMPNIYFDHSNDSKLIGIRHWLSDISAETKSMDKSQKPIFKSTSCLKRIHHTRPPRARSCYKQPKTKHSCWSTPKRNRASNAPF